MWTTFRTPLRVIKLGTGATIAGKESALAGRVMRHIEEHGKDTSFAGLFWKRCEAHACEIERYLLYVDCLLMHGQGESPDEISKHTGVGIQSVCAWISFRQRPKLAHFLTLYLELKRPRLDWVWLSVNNTPGHAIPLGPMVEVPATITDWKDVTDVLSQLEPLEPSAGSPPREYLFGFLVGMIIGDAAKSRTGDWHRHLGLSLSKKYSTNVKIGEFTCLCAQSVGLRMHRVADLRKPDSKPHGFYCWVSQASPLVDWIFGAVLGLKDGERTTYDAVRMDWVTKSSEDFRRGLVQGIAESDGSVNIASQTVEFWIGPNWDFFKAVLRTFGVASFRSREALSVTKTQVSKLGAIPAFSPLIETIRYSRFLKLVNARHIGHGKRIPPVIRGYIMDNARVASVPELAEQILDKFGVIVNFESVQRWIRRGQVRSFSATAV